MDIALNKKVNKKESTMVLQSFMLLKYTDALPDKGENLFFTNNKFVKIILLKVFVSQVI